MKWITLKKLSELSGMTEESARSCKKNGYWRDGVHWRKAPNGRIFICVNAVEKWIEGCEA